MNLRTHLSTAATISLALLIAGCGGQGDDTNEAASSTPATSTTSAAASPTSTASTSTAESTPAGGKLLNVTIRGRSVTPAPASIELHKGQTLRLVVTSDHDDELHAHGFNKEATLKAGQPTTLDLMATDPGVYEVETHHPELKLLSVEVR